MGFNETYNLGLKKPLPVFLSNNKTVSLGAETVIQTGSGGSEYMSFGDLAIDSSGKLHLVYRQGSGHNSGTDGHIRYSTSTDGGATWSAATTIITNGSGNENTTNPAIIVTSTGRIIVTFNKQDLPTSELTQLPYLIYSDNGGSSWSSNGYDGSETLISNDIAYLNNISHPVEVGGVLYMPLYSRVSVTSGNEYVLIYKSEDDGETWTAYNSSVTTGAFSAGETELLVRADGLWLIKSRGNGGGVRWSVNGGVDWWPDGIDISNTPLSKNPMAQSPSGLIVTVARQLSTNYSIYGYSNDGGYTWAYDRIDSREGSNEYAGVVWDGVNQRFVSVYWVETGTPFQSPTSMICRIINEV